MYIFVYLFKSSVLGPHFDRQNLLIKHYRHNHHKLLPLIEKSIKCVSEKSVKFESKLFYLLKFSFSDQSQFYNNSHPFYTFLKKYSYT